MQARVFKLFKDHVILNNPKQLQVAKKLGGDIICYVLISCSAPADEGQMQVEMAYEGDKTLASYLVQTAQKILED